MFRHSLSSCALLLSASLPLAQDWTNVGGGPARNGRSLLLGPTSAQVAWSNTQDFSIISWAPFAADGRVFTVREAGFPQPGGAANDAIVAYDLDSGAELWRETLPFGGDTLTEWIAWIGGARDGRVYVSRSSNLQPQPMIALDASTGATLWVSEVSTEAWAHDGLVFAPNGDLVLGDRLRVVRIDASDGSTVWETPRLCPVSGSCGVALSGSKVYLDEPAPSVSNRLRVLDLATGVELYLGPDMDGFTNQNTPFVGPDGKTVFLARTQNDPGSDFLYAFDDTGSALVERWARPVRWTTSHEHGLAADGSIYTFLPNDEFVRLDPATGNVTASAGVLAPLGSNLSPKTAVGADGTVYVSNGWASSPASDGRLWAFSADLATEHFQLQLDRPNAGGPALAGDGKLIVCDRTGVYAYQEPCAGSFSVGAAGCLDASAEAPELFGSGCPGPGQSFAFHMTGAPAFAPAFLGIGLGSAPLPVDPSCTLSIGPLGVSLGFPVDGDGQGSFLVDLPPSTSPAQLHLQVLVVDVVDPPYFTAATNVLVLDIQ